MTKRTRRTVLKQALADNGLRQDFIARQLGISKFRMSRIVLGHYRATPEEQRYIARVLRRPMRELFDDEALAS